MRSPTHPAILAELLVFSWDLHNQRGAVVRALYLCTLDRLPEEIVTQLKANL